MKPSPKFFHYVFAPVALMLASCATTSPSDPFLGEPQSQNADKFHNPTSVQSLQLEESSDDGQRFDGNGSSSYGRLNNKASYGTELTVASQNTQSAAVPTVVVTLPLSNTPQTSASKIRKLEEQNGLLRGNLDAIVAADDCLEWTYQDGQRLVVPTCGSPGLGDG